MNKKTVLCLVLAAIFCITAVLTAQPLTADAAQIDVKSSALFTEKSGNVDIGEMTADGVEITLNSGTTVNSFNYTQNVSMDVFEFEFDTNKRFDKITFVFTEIDDTSNLVYVYVEKVSDGVYEAYTKSDSDESEHVDVSNVILPVISGSEAETDMFGMLLGYDQNAEKSFTLNGVSFGDKYGFEYNIVTMSVEYYIATTTTSDPDAVVLVESLTNRMGKQEFKTGAEEIDVLIWQNALVEMPEGVVGEGDFEGKTVYTYNGLKGKPDTEYTFPVYGISMVGSTLSTLVYEVEAETKTLLSETARTAYTLGELDTHYEIRISNNTEVHILMVTTVEDTVAPLFNQAELNDYIAESLPNSILYTEANDRFPNLKNDGVFVKDLFVFTEEDGGIDTIDNISLRVGYKTPSSTSDWTWSTSYTVPKTSEGTISFKYKVIDVSGNETESDEFIREIYDNTPPTVTATESLTAYLGKLYTVPTPTTTDTTSGVDLSKTTIKVFKGVRGDTENAVEIELSVTNSFTPDVLTPDDDDYTYWVEYTASDYRGNMSSVVYSYITVNEPIVEDPVEEEFPWLMVALIAVSLVLVVVIVVLLFYKPKEEKFADGVKYVKSDGKDKNKSDDNK